MKKVLITFLVAIAGGAFSLGLYKIFEKDNREIVYQNEQIPVYATNQKTEKQIISPDFGEAAEQTINGVVHVKTQYEYKNNVYDLFFGYGNPFHNSPHNQQNTPIMASGSGVIISEDGYIATNNHVVQGASYIEVTLNDKRTFEATVVGTDPSSDLALLKINEKNLPLIRFGNSDDIKIGEWVLAVGNPFNLTSTVTAGIVSAKARNINILGSSSAVESFIQTDAAVNRGNSGGALVNTLGELIGINAAIASNTGTYTGYSFAIPSNLVKKVMNDLLEFGEVKRAYIGVQIADLDSKLAEEKGLKEIKGVYVAGLTENGAAIDAGIKKGDVITKINDIEVNSRSELIEHIATHRPGDKVSVTVNRNNNLKSFNVTLRNEEGNTSISKTKERNIETILGADFDEITSEEKRTLNIENGIKITKLETGKLKIAGIKEGFIITKIDKKPITTISELKKILDNKKGGILLEGVYPNGTRAYYGFGL
ncbi:MAG: Do family serine endopeptidase [Saprospiraceae bacterium]|nr:Do family serine endopeptidase [Saprospiraceae bacterium]